MAETLTYEQQVLVAGVAAFQAGGELDAGAVAGFCDLLLDAGQETLSLAYRWMFRHRMRPARREWGRVRQPLAWYCDEYLPRQTRESRNANDNPFSCLPLSLFVALSGRSGARALYGTWEEAVEDLADALVWLRELTEV